MTNIKNFLSESTLLSLGVDERHAIRAIRSKELRQRTQWSEPWFGPFSGYCPELGTPMNLGEAKELATALYQQFIEDEDPNYTGYVNWSNCDERLGDAMGIHVSALARYAVITDAEDLRFSNLSKYERLQAFLSAAWPYTDMLYWEFVDERVDD